MPKSSTIQTIDIGNENLFGEFVTVHTPVNSVTSVANYINVGTNVHIAHDVNVEDRAIINSHSCLAGYVNILRGANVGIGTNIHPRIIVGQYSIIGLGSAVIRHVLPGATVAGNPQAYIKPNFVGMKRNDLSKICVEELSRCLNKDQVVLADLSSDAQLILMHFLEKLKNQYIRNVPYVPTC